MRNRIRVGVALSLLAIGGACQSTPRVRAQQAAKAQDSPVKIQFTDIRKQAGITFVQDSTESDEKYYLETMGTGVAWIDYDQDGLMDLYFRSVGRHRRVQPAQPLRSALYHNNGDGTFTDVTVKAGVGGEGHYGQGVAVGDFDNDGFPDLYVTGYGRAILYQNNGDGTFTDVTEKPAWATREIGHPVPDGSTSTRTAGSIL